MDISIGDALGHIVEFPCPFILQLLAGGLLRHLVQQALNVLRCMVIAFTLICIVVLGSPSAAFGNTICLLIGDASVFFRGYCLLPTGSAFHISGNCAFFRRIFGLGDPGRRTLGFGVSLGLGLFRAAASFRLAFFCLSCRLRPFPGSGCHTDRTHFGDRCAAALAGHRASGHCLQNLRDGLGQRFCGTGRLGLLLALFADLQEILDIVPAANQYEIDDLEPFFSGGIDNGGVQIVDQFEHDLDTLIAEGSISVLDFTELHIRQHDLQDALKDMAVPVILFLDKLRYRRNALILLLP